MQLVATMAWGRDGPLSLVVGVRLRPPEMSEIRAGGENTCPGGVGRGCRPGGGHFRGAQNSKAPLRFCGHSR